MKYYGFDKEGAKEAIENYRIYYRQKGIFEAPLYANVEKTLAVLLEEGKKLFVATSKPEVQNFEEESGANHISRVYN